MSTPPTPAEQAIQRALDVIRAARREQATTESDWDVSGWALLEALGRSEQATTGETTP